MNPKGKAQMGQMGTPPDQSMPMGPDMQDSTQAQGTPPPEVLASLATIATSLDPAALGLILFNALNNAHLPANAQGLKALEGSAPVKKPMLSTPPAFGR